MKIAVVGAGQMGSGIAHVFAQYQHQVNLVDVSKERLHQAMASIEKNMNRQVAKDRLTEDARDSALGEIYLYTDLKEAVKDRDLVIEAATENEELKLQIFNQLSQFTSTDCILASNTSSISITNIASVCKQPENVIGMHFMNPVPVMKLVEIIQGYKTSGGVTDIIVSLSEDIQKVPVVVQDYPGFVSNRILMPMINEAIYTLFQQVAGVEQIDTIMKLGMAHPMGPLQLADYIGLDTCQSILQVLYKGFGNPKYAPCPLLNNMVAAGQLGVKSGQGFYVYLEGNKIDSVSPMFS